MDGGPLASLTQLDIVGEGAIPDHVTERRDAIVALQGRRLIFANFVAAALFGRLSALRNTSLLGAVNVGMNDVLAFSPRGQRLVVERTRYTTAVLGPKLNRLTGGPALRFVPPEDLATAIAFIEQLPSRAAEFAYANLEVCMAMNYQAAILHNAQHAPASLALNFSVAEALVKEIFLCYGLVAGEPRRSFATKSHTIAARSRSSFRGMSMATMLPVLESGGLISGYLAQRLQQSRSLRNNLMHGAVAVAVTESGPMQTAVRDLWSLLLDAPFELTAGYTMRL